jgi:hypothetical protein
MIEGGAMTHRQLTSFSLIVIVVFIVPLVECGGFPPNVHGDSLTTAQATSPSIVQFPWENNHTFWFVNETSYLTTFRNGTSLKEPMAIHGYEFNGTVRVSAIIPPGINVSVQPSTVSLSGQPYSYGFYNLTLAGTIPGTYNMIVTATNGTISNTLTITAIVTDGPDFVLVPSYPYSGSAEHPGINEGYAGRQLVQAIMVWSTGFQGQVNLSAQVSPLGPSTAFSLSTNVEEYVGPASQTISRYVQANGKNFTLLEFNSTNTTDYTVTVNGTAGARTHLLNVLFTVRDFNISLSTIASTPLTAGAFVFSQISVTALNGFSDRINFTCYAPLGFSVILSPGNVNGSGVVTMKVIDNSADPGSYNITVNAVTPYYLLTHSVTLTVEAISPLYIPVNPLPWITAISSIWVAGLLLLRRMTSRSLTENPAH